MFESHLLRPIDYLQSQEKRKIYGMLTDNCVSTSKVTY